MKIKKMNFYKRKQKWKYALFTVAIIISSLSIYLTRTLEKSLEESINSLSQSIETLKQNEETLKREEAENMANFAKAIQHLNNMDPEIEGDFSFSMEIVKQNVRIPLILIDECQDILQTRNLNIPLEIERDPEKKKSFIINELETMERLGDSIFIDVFGEKQRLYYKNSDILNQTSMMHEFTLEKQKFTKEILNEMKWYPFYQLSFILLFVLFAYFIFNAARKSEQNQVWAGMAKETAHQIGTPLSSLIAWVELLKQDNNNEVMTKEMEKDLKRLQTITERFSKIGSKAELIEENLEDIISESISYMEKRFSKNIQFDQQSNLIEKKLKINKVLIIWVIENICKNAADAMKGEGVISINCTEHDKNVQILISDTGSGIDKSIVKSIFMPGITSKKRGWGLGLSLVKRIIEDYHKGKIFVEKSSKDEGTTFCIILPK
ncbi:MAG: ATP-binding protein [Flavobacteriales bacterium]|nr:ATP-binding protein [Flavobacteriales bacterium]|tara:strand:+ start:6927 stop:8234 length:1308 start_codon:yes stop_codon:yes gene_type:complete